MNDQTRLQEALRQIELAGDIGRAAQGWNTTAWLEVTAGLKSPDGVVPTASEVAEALGWGLCGGWISWRSSALCELSRDPRGRVGTWAVPFPAPPLPRTPDPFEYVTRGMRRLGLAFAPLRDTP